MSEDNLNYIKTLIDDLSNDSTPLDIKKQVVEKNKSLISECMAEGPGELKVKLVKAISSFKQILVEEESMYNKNANMKDYKITVTTDDEVRDVYIKEPSLQEAIEYINTHFTDEVIQLYEVETKPVQLKSSHKIVYELLEEKADE